MAYFFGLRILRVQVVDGVQSSSVAAGGGMLVLHFVFFSPCNVPFLNSFGTSRRHGQYQQLSTRRIRLPDCPYLLVFVLLVLLLAMIAVLATSVAVTTVLRL